MDRQDGQDKNYPLIYHGLKLTRIIHKLLVIFVNTNFSNEI